MYLPPVISVDILWFVTLHLASLSAHISTAGKNSPVGADFALQEIRKGVCSHELQEE